MVRRQKVCLFFIFLNHHVRDAPKTESELVKEKFLKDEQRKLKEDPFEAKFKSLSSSSKSAGKTAPLELVYDKYYDDEKRSKKSKKSKKEKKSKKKKRKRSRSSSRSRSPSPKKVILPPGAPSIEELRRRKAAREAKAKQKTYVSVD